MKTKQKEYTVAAIVARFQVHELTVAHKELIQSIVDSHPKVLIFLGLSPVRGSTNNPLDFQPRKQMILESFPPAQYPNITIGYIKDVPSDAVWSETLDKLIEDHLAPNDTVVLYGGRDSFLQYYKGKYPTLELVSSKYISGTEIRKALSEKPQSHPLFRAGVIFGAYQRYPTAYSTVDIAVYDPKGDRLLLARKNDEDLFRFVGGFVSPKDDSTELAALRELYEETTLTVGLEGLEYLGSYKVDDWRYRNEQDKIITHFYLGYYTMGTPKASDDIAEVVWVNNDKLTEDQIVPEHHMLFHALRRRQKATSFLPGYANLQTVLLTKEGAE